MTPRITGHLVPRLVKTGFALAAFLACATQARGDAITYSTTGNFVLPTLSTAIIGVYQAPVADYFLLGSIPQGSLTDPYGPSSFQVQVQFSDGLPPINLSGTIGYVTYNFDEPVAHAAVLTTASAAQIASYPDVFQRLIAHPDWLHTTSFYSGDGVDNLPVYASVHVEDPLETRPVPEPSSVAIFGLVLAGIARRAWAKSRRA